MADGKITPQEKLEQHAEQIDAPKIRMTRFMPKQLHAQKSANRSAKHTHAKQYPLRNPTPTPFCLAFIKGIDKKGKRSDSRVKI